MALGCIPCLHMGQEKNAEELHHAGPADERDDMNQVPVCRDCHTGPNGIHGLHRRGFEMRTKLNDFKMIAMTRKRYMQTYGA